MIWIPITISAAALQVARNAAQRSIMGDAGPWGATLVRFLFGLPFATLFAAIAWLVTPGATAHPTVHFWMACAAGAGLQIAATAALLTAMQRSTFALGTAMQQSGLPFALVWGVLFFGDHVGVVTWAGGLIASVGLAILTWPRGEVTLRKGAVLAGLGSGAIFALSANCFRQASLAFDPAHPAASAFVTVMVVQAIQTVALTSYLAWRDRAALGAVIAAWRQSLGAGFCGAAASGLWFTAMALSPVGPVRAVGVIEMPIAAIAGRRLFKERLTALQVVAGAITAVGVVMAALG
ncbi:drug/metabolite transporter (DMT)-like permease [Caulobacter sp. BE264]|uniref:DMT family transporter n=1 Tax=Caulobacter sp. BE264 TaxID=2817724 RepID=UPI00286194FF|nr:DMT family transporter [Caulobacter sp. BE264]MDR7231832.1 drug/metabolite transporter (DMT)-like permease [Caulobacter sp. BE264]